MLLFLLVCCFSVVVVFCRVVVVVVCGFSDVKKSFVLIYGMNAILEISLYPDEPKKIKMEVFFQKQNFPIITVGS